MTALLAYPYYPANAWQDLIYGAARESGCEIVPLNSLRELERWGSGDVVHLGWTAPITQVHGCVSDAMRAVAQAERELTKFRERGGRIVWTVHNVLPHERNVLIPELALCQAFADLADVVHIMSAATVPLTSPYYRIDESKCVHIPHPSYLSAYPDPPTREQARTDLGIDTDVLLVVTLGTIRHYKGVDRVIRVAKHSQAVPVKTGQPTRVDVRFAVLGNFAGSVSGTEVQDALGDRGVVIDRYLSDDEIARWSAAADVFLLPYHDILNSGTIELAATFGRPVVTSDLLSLRQQLADAEWVRLVDFDAPAADAHVMNAVAELAASPSASSEALTYAVNNHPGEVTRQFLSRCLVNS